MKKILLGTSALAAVALTAGAASADAPVVAFDGAISYAVTSSSFDDNSAGLNGPGWNVEADNLKSELHWTATGTADNGLEYTGKVDWRYLTATLDEAWISVGGSWGKALVGMDDGVTAGVPDAHSLAGASWGHDGSFSQGVSHFMTPIGHSGDDPKVAYYSPSFGGFSFAASLAPDDGEGNATADAGADTARVGTTAGTYQNTAQLLASYSGDFSGVGVNLGAGYVSADATDGASTEDARSWHLGGTVSVADFGFGAGYVDNGDSGTLRTANGDAGHVWNVGVSYDGIENVYLSAVYQEGESDIDGNNADLTSEGWSVSADYTVADGLVTFVEYMHGTSDTGANTSASETEADVFLLGTTISF